MYDAELIGTKIKDFMDSNSMIQQRTHVMYHAMVDSFDTTVTDHDKAFHKQQLAEVVRDGGFDNSFTVIDQVELAGLVDIIVDVLVDNTLAVESPVDVNDIVYVLENNNVIPCKVKLVRALKSAPKTKPTLEIYLTAISKNDKLQGCTTNIMNSIDPSCESQDSSTWVTMAMYSKYWFLTEDEARTNIK